MIQTWSHTRHNFSGANATNQMRYGGSLNMSPCISFEGTDNQPILRGEKLTEKKI